jgi:hypothetical protein
LWLFVPEMSSLSAPESVGLSSELPSLSDCAAKMLAASATWRGKPQPPQAWSRRWKAGGFIQRLSGLTFSPSTLALGVDLFISSLRATHARTTALPETRLAQTASGSSHPKLSASPASAGLILSSEKTCRGTRTDSLKPSSQHWSNWASALRQEYSVRPKPVIPCGAKDCSSWPGPDATNRVRDAETMEKCAAFRLRNAGQKTVPLYLAEVAQDWHAPRCNDPEKRGQISDDPRNGIAGQVENWAGPKVLQGGPNSNREARGAGGPDLQEQATAWAAPAAQNHKGSSEGSSEGSMVRQDGKSREDILSYQAEQFFRPPSSQDQPTAGGSMSSIDGPNSNQPSAKRKLNPIFVEALMRWPTGLSGFERQEMAWTRWWLLMPSYLSELCSPPERQQMSLL